MRAIKTYHLFSEITEKLITLLRGLSIEKWDFPTCYPTWKVKDIVAHLIQTAVSRLSVQRDRYISSKFFDLNPQFKDLSATIDQINTNWSLIFSQISPRILLDFIEIAERQLAHFIQSQDLHSDALYSVAWAGESRSENWFDLGRDYTERWVHQQQIREAVGGESLATKRYLSPVFHLFMYSVPFWYRDVQAIDGTIIKIQITGESGGEWCLRRKESSWSLEELSSESSNTIQLHEDVAWRFFTRSLPVESFKDQIQFSNDSELLQSFYNVRAIMMND